MLLSAIPIIEDNKEILKERVKNLKEIPTLAIIKVGDDKASEKYIINKQKLCDDVGVKSLIVRLDSNSTHENVADTIERLNRDNNITSILLQLPLPKGLDSDSLTELINPDKDVDGFTSRNLGRLVLGLPSPRACTPVGIIKLLDYYNISLRGKDVLIINRSNIVGKPLALMMLERDATVTIAHSKTRNIFDKIKNADVVVTAVGRSNFLRAKDFKKDAVVIDVSINLDCNGKLCGDVNKDDYDKINLITPVPNGIGRTTVLSLVEQCVTMQEAKESKYD